MSPSIPGDTLAPGELPERALAEKRQIDELVVVVGPTVQSYLTLDASVVPPADDHSA